MSPRRLAVAFAVFAVATLLFDASREPWRVTTLDLSAWQAPRWDTLLANLRATGVCIAILLAGAGLGRAFRPLLAGLPEAGLRHVAALGLGLAALSVATLGLAALHLALPSVTGSLLALAAAAGAHALWQERDALRAHRAGAAIGTALLLSPALAAFGANPGWDALTYHLAIPERYLHANGIVVSPWSVLSAYPHATAMLYLHAEALDAVPAASALHLAFGALAAWLVWDAARQASPRAGLFALAALAACPLFTWELSVAYADLSATFYTLLAVRILTAAPPTWHEGRVAALVGSFAGCAAACRYPSWPLVPIVAAVLAFHRPGAARWRAPAIALGCAALPLLPWLVRNLVFTGNPTSPLLQEALAPVVPSFFAPEALAQNRAFLDQIGPGRGLLDLLRAPFDLTFRARFGDYQHYGFRIGALYLVGIVAALFARAARPVGPSAAAPWWIVGLTGLAWFYTAQEPRYLLPTLALVAWLGAVAADRLVPARASAWSWGAVLALAVAQAQLPQWSALPQRLGVAIGSLPLRERPIERLAARLRASLAPEDRVVMFFEPLARPMQGLDYVPHHLGNGSPLLVALHDAVAEQDVGGLFVTLGATHVLLETRPGVFATPQLSEGYTYADLTRDVRALGSFLEARGREVEREGTLVVYALEARS